MSTETNTSTLSTTHIKFHWSPNDDTGYGYAGWVETIRRDRRRVGIRVLKPVEVRLADGPHQGESITIPTGTECRELSYGLMAADIPAVTAVFDSDGTPNEHAASRWAEMLDARPELVGCHRVTASYCDLHARRGRGIWTVTIWVRREIAELIDRPTSTWQFARSAPSVGNYDDRYHWAGAVLEDPDACREQADQADREVDDHYEEQNLWQEAYAACPLPRASPQDVPERRLIGSMGFKAWKAEYDSAVLANQQYADWMRWVNNYAAKRS